MPRRVRSSFGNRSARVLPAGSPHGLPEAHRRQGGPGPACTPTRAWCATQSRRARRLPDGKIAPESYRAIAWLSSRTRVKWSRKLRDPGRPVQGACGAHTRAGPGLQARTCSHPPLSHPACSSVPHCCVSLRPYVPVSVCPYDPMSCDSVSLCQCPYDPVSLCLCVPMTLCPCVRVSL